MTSAPSSPLRPPSSNCVSASRMRAHRQPFRSDRHPYCLALPLLLRPLLRVPRRHAVLMHQPSQKLPPQQRQGPRWRLEFPRMVHVKGRNHKSQNEGWGREGGGCDEEEE